LAELFEFDFGFGERRLGNRNHATTGLPALAPQADDAPDLFETEAERLRFADKAYLL